MVHFCFFLILDERGGGGGGWRSVSMERRLNKRNKTQTSQVQCRGGGGRGLGHFCYNMKTKIHENKSFKKISQKALNHDLTLPSDSTRRDLPESSGILEKGLICVELRSFYCRKRILVPMSYISWLDINHSSKRKNDRITYLKNNRSRLF